MAKAGTTLVTVDRVEVEQLIRGEHANPHYLLGPHSVDGGLTPGGVIRVWRPDASAVEVVLADGRRVAAERLHDAGLFAAVVDAGVTEYQVEASYADGNTWLADDPY